MGATIIDGIPRKGRVHQTPALNPHRFAVHRRNIRLLVCQPPQICCTKDPILFFAFNPNIPIISFWGKPKTQKRKTNKQRSKAYNSPVLRFRPMKNKMIYTRHPLFETYHLRSITTTGAHHKGLITISLPRGWFIYFYSHMSIRNKCCASSSPATNQNPKHWNPKHLWRGNPSLHGP